MSKEMLKIILCVVTIICYFIIMKIKTLIIKKSCSTKTNNINFIINLCILLVCFSVIIIINNDFDFKQIGERFSQAISNPSAVRIIVSLAFVVIISITLYNTIRTVLIKPYRFDNKFEKRKATIVKVALSFLRYAIYVIDTIIVLALFGIDITPVLAGLGVAGIVIGLGAQKLIVDFINGMFIIFERHFDVGDTIEVSGFKGQIIDIGLKTTRIRNWKGEVKIIANGEILQLINFSLNDSLAVIEFLLPYAVNHQEIIDCINKELPPYLQDEPNVVSTPYVVGITVMNQSTVSIRVVAPTLSETHYAIERKMRLKIIEILQRHGIEAPHEQIVINVKGSDNNDR